MKHIQFWYRFHAVGQGLFASGHLRESERDRQFHWVLDCGTSSRRAFVQREIDYFRPNLDSKPIGLFCLSHFDEDHINGARELLSRQRVEVLVMPYFPLVERIQIAFSTPGLSDDYIRFLVDPAGYMFTAAGENLGEVILIAGEGGPPDERDAAASGDVSDNPDDGWDFRRPDTKLQLAAREDVRGVSDRDSHRVSVFNHKMPFNVGGAWEFLFFNENVPNAKTARLREEIVGTIKRYRRPDGSFEGTGLLRELKPLYVRQFGSSGLAQNRISLVTYSGPIKKPGITGLHFSMSLIPVGVEVPVLLEWFRTRRQKPSKQKASIGYFGDFPLSFLGKDS